MLDCQSISFKLRQPAKGLSYMAFTDEGILIVCNSTLLKKARFPIALTVSGKTISFMTELGSID